MHVIRNRVHTCTKAKHSVLFFEFPDMLFERYSYLKSVFLLKLKSENLCTSRKGIYFI